MFVSPLMENGIFLWDLCFGHFVSDISYKIYFRKNLECLSFYYVFWCMKLILSLVGWTLVLPNVMRIENIGIGLVSLGLFLFFCFFYGVGGFKMCLYPWGDCTKTLKKESNTNNFLGMNKMQSTVLLSSWNGFMWRKSVEPSPLVQLWPQLHCNEISIVINICLLSHSHGNPKSMSVPTLSNTTVLFMMMLDLMEIGHDSLWLKYYPWTLLIFSALPSSVSHFQTYTHFFFEGKHDGRYYSLSYFIC